AAHPWAGSFRNFWDKFHGAVVAVTLGGAILLTVYSLVVYLYRYRTLLKGGGSSKASPSAPSCWSATPWIRTPRTWAGSSRRRALGGGPGRARGRAAPRSAARNARALGGAGAPAYRRKPGQRAPRRGVTHGAHHGYLRVGPGRADRADRARDRAPHPRLPAF